MKGVCGIVGLWIVGGGFDLNQLRLMETVGEEIISSRVFRRQWH